MKSPVVRMAHLPEGIESFIGIAEESADTTYNVFVSDAIAEDRKAHAVSASLDILRKKYGCVEEPIFVEELEGSSA